MLDLNNLADNALGQIKILTKNQQNDKNNGCRLWLVTDTKKTFMRLAKLKTRCKINLTFESQKPPNFKVVIEW